MGDRRSVGCAVIVLGLAALAFLLVLRCDAPRPRDRVDVDVSRDGTRYPEIPRIDVHVHVAPEMAGAAVRLLARGHVALALNASGGVPGESLAASASARRATGGRLVPYCNFVEFRRATSPAFPRYARAYLEACRDGGAVGLKIAKGLGLGATLPDGSLLAVDDPRLDPLFEAAGELGLPVLIHAGDPQAFFRPPTPDNERYDELSAHPDWSFHGPRPNGAGDYPPWEEVFAQYRRRVLRHPGTTFVGAHFGNAPEEPARVEEMLRAHPRYYVETGARIPEIGRHPPAAMHRFFTEFQDRILFGTDLGVGPWGLTLGSSGREPDREERVAPFFAAHYRWFETDGRGMEHPTPIQGRWTIDGIALPRAVLEKVYYRNAARVFRLTLPR